MGKYLHKYDDNSTFLSDYNGTYYHEPWVSLTLENGDVNYNKQTSPKISDLYEFSGLISPTYTDGKYLDLELINDRISSWLLNNTTPYGLWNSSSSNHDFKLYEVSAAIRNSGGTRVGSTRAGFNENSAYTGTKKRYIVIQDKFLIYHTNVTKKTNSGQDGNVEMYEAITKIVCADGRTWENAYLLDDYSYKSGELDAHGEWISLPDEVAQEIGVDISKEPRSGYKLGDIKVYKECNIE